MKKREIFRLLKNKTNKLLIVGLLSLASIVGFSYFTANSIQAASTLEIIQNRDDLSQNLKPFMYVGERMDWDVKLEGVASGGTAETGFTWTSSNNAVVSMEDGSNSLGVLVAHAKGTATIKVIYTDGAVATATIRIKQPASSISLAKTATVYVGKPVKFNAVVNPTTTDDKGLGMTWKSSNTAIASVDSTGKVTARKNGTVTITATFTNRDRFGTTVPATVSASTKVTVRTLVSKVSLNKKSFTLYKGKKTSGLRATVYPSTANNKAYTWKSSNTKVATVNSKGLVTAKNYGEATITVTTKDGNKKASAKVIVPRLQKGSNLTKGYIYRFSNSSSAFFKGKQKRNYSMYTKDKNNLINKIYVRHKNEETKNEIKLFVNRSINRKWDGSCFGISMTTALNRTGQINIRKHTKSKGKGYQLSKVYYPKNSNRVKSTINFYQIMTPYYFDDYRLFYDYKNSKNRQTGLKSVVATAKKNQLQSFDFYGTYKRRVKQKNGKYKTIIEHGGHAILIKNYSKVIKSKGKRYYRLNTYDSNYPNRKTYLYIRTDYKVLKIQHYNWTLTDFDVLSNFKEYDYAKINK